MYSWVPEQYAVKDKWLMLKQMDGNWEDRWQVREVFSRESFKSLQILSNTYRYTRQVSDI